jgi:hypothetical protein
VSRSWLCAAVERVHQDAEPEPRAQQTNHDDGGAVMGAAQAAGGFGTAQETLVLTLQGQRCGRARGRDRAVDLRRGHAGRCPICDCVRLGTTDRAATRVCMLVWCESRRPSPGARTSIDRHRASSSRHLRRLCRSPVLPSRTRGTCHVPRRHQCRAKKRLRFHYGFISSGLHGAERSATRGERKGWRHAVAQGPPKDTPQKETRPKTSDSGSHVTTKHT